MTLTTIERPATRARDATAVTMKAFVYRGPGKKALEERPRPDITAPTDAIVKVVKTTICGTDLHILKGDVPTCQRGRAAARHARRHHVRRPVKRQCSQAPLQLLLLTEPR